MKRSLVLAGGGVVGVAWELGVLRGIEDADPQLSASLCHADFMIGTSAGATVAAQITSGETLDMLYSTQVSGASNEIEVDLDLETLTSRLATAAAAARDAEDLRRRIGALAINTPTVSEPTRRRAIAARLPRKDWPNTRIQITAVNATSGELAVFTQDSGVDLIDAVAASCALPCVWPPVTIGGFRYIDGGVRSRTNADLAAGSDRVLILAPYLASLPSPWNNLKEEVTQLAPGKVHIIYADQQSITVFGNNPLSPAARGPAAREGRTIGRAQVAAVRSLWYS